MLPRSPILLRNFAALASRPRGGAGDRTEAAAVSGQLLCNHIDWLVNQRRWHINLQHPRSPHFLRAKMLAVMRPIYAPDDSLPLERCTRVLHPKVENPVVELHPLEVLLVKEAKRIIGSSKMLVLCHRNLMSGQTLTHYRNKIWKLNLRIWPMFNNKILRAAVTGTRYAALLAHLELTTLLITSTEVNLADLYKGLMRFPTVVPLVIVINEERIISYPQLEALAKKTVGGLPALHAEMSSTLSNASTNLLQVLQHQHFTLSASLDFLAKQKAPQQIVQ